MNDLERIKAITTKYFAQSDGKMEDEILQLFISIAGERIREKERVKANIYQALLTNQVIKPEAVKTVYQLLQKAKEHL